MSIAEEFEVTFGDKVDDRSLTRRSRLGCLVDALTSNIEEFIDVYGRCEGPVLQLVELTHTDLTEVTRVILVEEDSVMVLSTSVTAATRMLTVLADTTVSHGDMAALLACFVETGGHDGK